MRQTEARAAIEQISDQMSSDSAQQTIFKNQADSLTEEDGNAKWEDAAQYAVVHHARHAEAVADAAGTRESGIVPQPAHPDGLEAFDRQLHIVRDGNRLMVSPEPEGMGRLDINLSLERGMLHAQVRVADDATRNLIGNNIQQILDALTREGLSVGGFSVSLKNGGADRGPNEKIHGYSRQEIEKNVTKNAAEEIEHNWIVNIYI